MTVQCTNDQFLLQNFSAFKSYSFYSDFAVAVCNDGTPMAIGDNSYWPIYKSLPRHINRWTRFNIKDSYGYTYKVKSAVCGQKYTLYLLDTDDVNRQLAYVKKNKNKGNPVFLTTDNEIIHSIYGGRDYAAAISNNGIIHIIDNSIYTNDNCTRIAYLPWANMPISIAFEGDCIIALSSYGNVYELNLNDGSKEFDIIDELPSCSFISGTADHCIAVSEDGEVFGRGSNEYNQLGLGMRVSGSYSVFERLPNLKNIDEAYAGDSHSLFVNEEGKVYGCGNNCNDETFVQNYKNTIIQPTGTSISSDAVFCVAGSNNSLVFVNCDPPKNSPNQKLYVHNSNPFPLMFYDYDALIAENNSLHAEINKLKTKNLVPKTIAPIPKLNFNVPIPFLDSFFNSNLLNKEKDSLTKGNISTQNEITTKKQIEPISITNDLQKKEIESQKKEIESQKKEIESKRKEIESQKEEIDRLKKEIEEFKKSKSFNNEIIEIDDDDDDDIIFELKRYRDSKQDANINKCKINNSNKLDDTKDEEESENDDDEYDDNFNEFFEINK